MRYDCAMNLTEFLLARWDEQERQADIDEQLGHISPADYTLGIAELNALRTVAKLHSDVGESQGYTDRGYGEIDHACGTCGTYGEYGQPWPCSTLRAIATPYADHPDYDEAWRV